MRSVLCILFIVFHRISSLIFMVKYTFLKKFRTKEKLTAYAYKWVQGLARGVLWCSGARMTVNGKENIPKDKTVLFVANHKSFFDIPILVSVIDMPMAFIGKMELKKTPVVSYWMKKINCIFMDRDDIRQSLKAINQGIEQIKEGQSLLIFPEGTRIIGDELGEFKKGSLKLATKTNAPIVPIYIGNAYNILETHFPWVKATDILVNIGSPIDLENLSSEEKKNLSEYVKNQIENLRKI
ncbi:MAG: 1-acyl-sn-glycerol-3-phosphate acyltransferase [Epulopiscium sp.]|nr:1-acyl-sn-glycerol-3-phosphate acyltransferase [Defluviitaleaceae bacterium]MDK2786784.1 1-acyl-sn-glycerol-3-phosphate acyltransferase [Candidatus Epulonipiscium sp.]